MKLLRQKDIANIEREALLSAARVMCDMCGGNTDWFDDVVGFPTGDYMHSHKCMFGYKPCDAEKIHRLIEEIEQ